MHEFYVKPLLLRELHPTMATYIPFLTNGQIRFFLLSNRVIQWLSSVVVLGINSYLIDKGPRGLFITYLEVVVSERTSKKPTSWLTKCQAVVSVVAFLPAFVAPFLSNPFKDFVLFIDVVFSYLWVKNICRISNQPELTLVRWITAFIFAAVNYNQNNCHLNAPPGVVCSKKWALEAFVFLTLWVFPVSHFLHVLTSIYSIFTFFALFIETLSLWKERKDQGRDHSQEKIHSSSLDNNQTEPSVAPNEAQNTEYPAATSSVVWLLDYLLGGMGEVTDHESWDWTGSHFQQQVFSCSHSNVLGYPRAQSDRLYYIWYVFLVIVLHEAITIFNIHFGILNN